MRASAALCYRSDYSCALCSVRRARRIFGMIPAEIGIPICERASFRRVDGWCGVDKMGGRAFVCEARCIFGVA